MSDHLVLTLLRPKQKGIMLQKLFKRKATAYFREGSFSDEIIWQDRKFVFPVTAKKMTDMWIFRSVANDVRAYMEGKKIRLKKKLPVNLWNKKMTKFDGLITATDVDHAYWRIAYQLGMITHRTYTRGLTIKDKSLRLAALANLASSKEYRVIENGILTNKSVILKFNPVAQKIYHNIRYTCFSYMTEIAERLGEDFICYKTDCIYYKDTPENRKIVHDYLDAVELEYKQLIEVDIPEQDAD
jgi:hypothetical protein